MNQKQKGNLALLTTGFLFGASSPLARLLSPFLSAFGVVGTRFLFALPFALLSIFSNKEKIAANRHNFAKVSIFGFIFPISVIFYTLALFNTKVSLAIFSFYLANLLSSVIVGKLIHKEKFGFAKKASILLSVLAIIILTKPFQNHIIDIGMLFGYFSGVIQTIASHYQKKFSESINETTLTLSQIIGGILVGFIIAFSLGDFGVFSLSPYALTIAVIFGFVIFLINKFLVYGFKRSDIGTGTILMSSEIIFGPIMAYIIFQETLTPDQMLAGFLAFMATILVSRK